MRLIPMTGFRLRAFAFRLFTVTAVLLALGSRQAPAQIPQTLDREFPDPEFVPGELLVKFNGGTAPGAVGRALAEEGANLREQVTPDGLVRVGVGGSLRLEDAIARWSRRTDVEYAAPNLIAHAFLIPNDTTITVTGYDWNLRQIDAYSAWDIVQGDPRIVLAIVDTGIAFEDHTIPSYERAFVQPEATSYRQSPDLPGPFLPGWDFVNNDAHPNDDRGHGTTMATIAAGAANNIAGSAGIAFGVTILPIKVLDFEGQGAEDDIIQGIRLAADQGADVINLSLGYAPVSYFRDRLGYSQQDIMRMFNPLRDAVIYARAKGSIVVAAAGNYGADEVSLPAGFPGVIAVGATAPDGGRASYSSWGPGLDFMAPGGEPETYRNEDYVWALGIKPHHARGSTLANPEVFDVFNGFGTSDAAAHVSGAVALMRSLGIKSQGAIEQTLRATALRSPGATGPFDSSYGYGLIQLGSAVRNPVGGGRTAQRFAAGLQSRLLSQSPARGTAAFAFRTTRSGPISVRIFNIQGALVRNLMKGSIQPGVHAMTWDGVDEHGEAAPSGIYFLRIESPEGRAFQKVAFLR
jgi:serine protease